MGIVINKNEFCEVALSISTPQSFHQSRVRIKGLKIASSWRKSLYIGITYAGLTIARIVWLSYNSISNKTLQGVYFQAIIILGWLK